MNRHMKIVLVLLLILIWGFFSWRWYTCAIKGFCDDGAKEAATEPVETGKAVPLSE